MCVAGRNPVFTIVRVFGAMLFVLVALHVPRGDVASAQSGSSDVTQSVVTYKVVDGVELELLVWRPADVPAEPERRLPGIVFYHGGGWSSGEAELFAPQARYLAGRGMVAISVGYRTRGPVVADEDGIDAWNFVHDHAAELGIDPQRVVAAGGSAGGQMALATGLLDLPNTDTDVRPAAIAVLNPVSDTTGNFPDGYGRNRFTSDEQARAYSPYHHIAPGGPPLLIMHGTGDATVHVQNSIDFVTAMRQAGNDATLVTYDGISHGFYNRQTTRYNRYFHETMREVDLFLQRLGLLSGPQEIRPEPTELLHNGGFEADRSRWDAGAVGFSTSEQEARTGRYAAVVDAGGLPTASLGQDVTEAVRRSGRGEYLMSAWVGPLTDAALDVSMSLSVRVASQDGWTTVTLPATTTADGRYVQVAGTAATRWEGALAEARLQVSIAGAAPRAAVDDVSLKFLPGRVGAWSFAEDTGTHAVDGSGYGYDGTIAAARWRQGGPGGGHLDLAGGGSVQVPQTVDPRGDFRVTAWIRMDSVATGDQVLLTQTASASEPWLYVPAGSTRLATGLGGRPLVGNVSLPLREWVQVTVMRGDGLLRLYVGDALAAASPRSVTNPRGSWLIGSPGGSAGTSWQGAIAAMDAYDHADTMHGTFELDPDLGYVLLGTMAAEQPLRGGQPEKVSVPVTSNLSSRTDVDVSLEVPPGWSAEPVRVALDPGEGVVVEVPVTAPAAPTTATLSATAHAGPALVLGDQVLTVVTTPSPAISALALDSGSASSPLLAGYERLAPEDAYSTDRAWGWVEGQPDTRDRARLDDLRRDFTMSTLPTTLRIRVPAGQHEVYLLSGDASFAAGRLVVSDGTTRLADTGSALATGEFVWLDFTLDGGSTGRPVDLTLSVEGSGNWRLNALAVLD